MRVLVLTAAERLPDLSTFYDHLSQSFHLDIRRLDKRGQLHLRHTLNGIDLTIYQRTLVDLPFRHLRQQSTYLNTLPGLLIYEEDACQNYLPHSRHCGQFTAFYARLPRARVVVTGATLAERLRQDGVDACFLAKGYDPAKLFVEPAERDIELGFIGRLASAEYVQRQQLLLQLMAHEPLQLLRSEPGEDYRRLLNRIQVFVSADVGLGEYMAKNFEAMACGCLLLAWRQEYEEQALALQDGEHVLLYGSLAELRAHIQQLRADPQRLQRIASAGCEWVQAQRSYRALAAGVGALLRQDWPVSGDGKCPSSTWWQRLWQR